MSALRLAVIGGGAYLSVLPAAAQDARFSLDAGVSGGVASNPLLDRDRDSEGAFLDLTVNPRVLLVDAGGDTQVSGYYRRFELFSGDEGPSQNYGGSASTQQRLSSRMTLSAGVSYDSIINGLQRLIGAVDNPFPETGGPPDLEVPDLSQLGLRTRQNTLGANMRTQIVLGALDSIGGSIAVSRSDFDNNAFAYSYNSYSANVNYTRTLSERSTIGGQVVVQRIDYQGIAGESLVVQPAVTFTRALNANWRLEGNVGALYTDTDNVVLGRLRSTTVSGNVTLCGEFERTNVCLIASRDGAATGTGGVSRQISAQLTGRYQLTEKGSVRGTAIYSRSDQQGQLFGDDVLNYWSVDGGYDHLLSRRLTLGGAVSYRLINNASGDTQDVRASIYINARIGEI